MCFFFFCLLYHFKPFADKPNENPVRLFRFEMKTKQKMTEIENVGVADKTTWAQTLLCVGWRQTSGESVCKSELILMRWMMKDEHTVIDYYDHRHSRFSLWNIHCWWFREFFFFFFALIKSVYLFCWIFMCQCVQLK